MTTEAQKSAAPVAAGKDDWNVPKPAEIPRPTYVPAAMALGLTFFFWGFVTSPVVFIMGLLVIAFALASWVREMRHE
jgi:hypothetical protein